MWQAVASNQGSALWTMEINGNQWTSMEIIRKNVRWFQTMAMSRLNKLLYTHISRCAQACHCSKSGSLRTWQSWTSDGLSMARKGHVPRTQKNRLASSPKRLGQFKRQAVCCAHSLSDSEKISYPSDCTLQ